MVLTQTVGFRIRKTITSVIWVTLTSTTAFAASCRDSLIQPPSTETGYTLDPLINRGIRVTITEWFNWHFKPPVPEISIEEIQLVDNHALNPAGHNGDHLGGDSTSIQGVYRGTPVHVKQISRRDKAEIKLAVEMSRRNLSPQILGTTDFMDGKTIGIVSEFMEPLAFVKTLYHFGQATTSRVVAPVLKRALEGCPECQVNWIENLKIIEDFLYKNKVSILDPQLMLLRDGRVLLYDFGLYEVGDTEASMVHATRLQFQFIRESLESL